MELQFLEQLAVSLGLGLLVGFQREWSPGKKEAGIRTFALITVFGTMTARIAGGFGGWVMGAGLLAVAVIILTAQYQRISLSTAEKDFGVTTEIAALVMYGVGIIVVRENAATAVVIGGVVTVLLHWKNRLHGFVSKIGEKDIRAIVQLILIWLVILPVLPNRNFGPFNVLNLHHIWLMVVLIVGISLGGYIAYKFLGPRTGTLLAGLFGGLVSSTAATVTYARQSRSRESAIGMCAAVIMIASTIVFLRVILEIGIVAPKVLPEIILPILTLMALMTAVSLIVFLKSRQEDSTAAGVEGNPAELKTAVIFGLLYAVVLLGVAAAKEYMGDRGLYLVAAVSGLTDADAITLSTAKMINAGTVSIDTGWRMIMLGTLCNILFKGGLAAVIGSPALLKKIAPAFGLSILAGAVILIFWPAIG